MVIKVRWRERGARARSFDLIQLVQFSLLSPLIFNFGANLCESPLDGIL
jgi:hypothetical protein